MIGVVRPDARYAAPTSRTNSSGFAFRVHGARREGEPDHLDLRVDRLQRVVALRERRLVRVSTRVRIRRGVLRRPEACGIRLGRSRHGRAWQRAGASSRRPHHAVRVGRSPNIADTLTANTERVQRPRAAPAGVVEMSATPEARQTRTARTRRRTPRTARTNATRVTARSPVTTSAGRARWKHPVVHETLLPGPVAGTSAGEEASDTRHKRVSGLERGTKGTASAVGQYHRMLDS